jgi:sugar lactone lactonase YvrE/murein DD-endopeptidase MepM/ murein hydrolase activator NlpD
VATKTRRRLLIAAGALVATAAAGVASFLWWRAAALRPAPLEASWAAVVRTLAGNVSGAAADGPLANAGFVEPFGVAIGPDRVIYVTDGGAHRVRRITVDGRVETLAGSVRGFSDGPARAARFDTPSAIALDAAGVLYVADTGNHAVRRITPDGMVSTLAGDGTAGDADGATARFNGPVGVAVDGSGRVIVADTYNDRIRAIARDGTVSTIAGGLAPGPDDGMATDARFDTPCGVSVDASGNIHVADTGNGAVRRIDPDGAVTTRAYEADGVPMRPIAVVSGDDGALYVSDERGRVVEIDGAGQTRTVAGAGSGFRDGRGGEAHFRRLGGIGPAGSGRLVVADAGNAHVRAVTAVARSSAQVPWSPLAVPRFDETAFARTPLLWPVSPMDGPHEIAGTIGEARGTAGGERFHAGVDVRIDEGTAVRAVRAGTVLSPVSTGDFGTLNEWLRLGTVSYVHVRAGRARNGDVGAVPGFVGTYDDKGTLTRVRVRRGTHYAAGDVIATVNAFNHVHLNVGWPGEEVNPLRLRLSQFGDTIAPTIAARGVLFFNEDWTPVPHVRGKAPTVSGRVRIVVDAWDQADGNRPNRRLGLYALGYELLSSDGRPAPGSARTADRLVFDRLAPQPDAARLVYAPGSGIPFYGGRRTRFLYVVTNTFHDGVAGEDFWDTTSLEPGRYIVRVHARDISGNEARANRDATVIVAR